MNLEYLEDFLDTLEVKEVDFETAFATMIDVFDEKCGLHWCEGDLKEFAKHFFELGIKARQA